MYIYIYKHHSLIPFSSSLSRRATRYIETSLLIKPPAKERRSRVIFLARYLYFFLSFKEKIVCNITFKRKKKSFRLGLERQVFFCMFFNELSSSCTLKTQLSTCFCRKSSRCRSTFGCSLLATALKTFQMSN